MDKFDILDRAEMQRVIDAAHKYNGEYSDRQQAIFRLAACCGLRTGEIMALKVTDFNFNQARPGITIRAEATKRTMGRIPSACGATFTKKGKTRFIPLWWDAGTRTFLQVYAREREIKHGLNAYVVCKRSGHPYSYDGWGRDQINRSWRKLLTRALGPERAKQLTVKAGRRTFVSHALQSRHPIEVMRAVGHGSLATTTIYARDLDHERDSDMFSRERLTAAAPIEKAPGTGELIKETVSDLFLEWCKETARTPELVARAMLDYEEDRLR